MIIKEQRNRGNELTKDEFVISILGTCLPFKKLYFRVIQMYVVNSSNSAKRKHHHGLQIYLRTLKFKSSPSFVQKRNPYRKFNNHNIKQR